MNLIVNAVASIVDAHTHYLDASGSPDYRARTEHSRSIRSRSVLASIGALRSQIGNTVARIRAQIADKREVNRLLRLNDYLLKDIGLSRSDLLAVQAGIGSLAEVEAARNHKRISASKLSTHQLDSKITRAKAANASVYGVPECA